VVVEERPVPRPGADQVLVEVGHCGICGSDIHLMFEGWGKPGLVGGHEFTGHHHRPGRWTWRAGPSATRSSGGIAALRSCRRCLEGKPSQCENRQGPSIVHLDNGAFARYVLVNSRRSYACPRA
jgi:L-iditol 2-dehydrogenase